MILIPTTLFLFSLLWVSLVFCSSIIIFVLFFLYFFFSFFSVFLQKHRTFNGFELNLQSAFSRAVIFTIQILPIHKHGMLSIFQYVTQFCSSESSNVHSEFFIPLDRFTPRHFILCLWSLGMRFFSLMLLVCLSLVQRKTTDMILYPATLLKLFINSIFDGMLQVSYAKNHIICTQCYHDFFSFSYHFYFFFFSYCCS